MAGSWAVWRNVDSDRIICAGPCILYNVVILTSAANGSVTLYEGQDAESGDKVLTLEGGANVNRPIAFGPGLVLQRGLFVDVGSNVDEVLVVYQRLDQNTVIDG